jgi:hypothetical protein
MITKEFREQKADHVYATYQTKKAGKANKAIIKYTNFIIALHSEINNKTIFSLSNLLKTHGINTSGGTVLQKLEIIRRTGKNFYSWIYPTGPTETLAEMFRLRASEMHKKYSKNYKRIKIKKEPTNNINRLMPIIKKDLDVLNKKGIITNENTFKFISWLYDNLYKYDWTAYSKLRYNIKHKIEELKLTNITINSLEKAKIIERKKENKISYIRWIDLNNSPSMEMVNLIRNTELEFIKNLNHKSNIEPTKQISERILVQETPANKNPMENNTVKHINSVKESKPITNDIIDQKLIIINLAKRFSLLGEYEFAYNLLEPLV